MNKNSHNIQRVFLEIDTPSMVMANSIKNSLAMFLQHEVVPIFEKHFNLIKNIDNQIIQIEKLEIDIESIIDKKDISFSKNDIKNQIEKEVQKALNELQKTTKNEAKRASEILTISPEDKDLKTLLYFIENGSMPWWFSNENEADFFKKNNSDRFKNDIFRIPFIKLIQQKKVQNRIINQFSNPEIALLSSAVLSSEMQQKELSKNKLLQLLNQKSHTFKTAFWQLIFDFGVEKKPISLIRFYYKEQSQFSSHKITFENFIQNLKMLVNLDFTNEELMKIKTDYLVSEKEKPIIKPNSDTKEEKKSEFEIRLKEESIIEDDYPEDHGSKSCYVQNAGLIILHPFLKEMLQSCGLMDESNTLLNKELAAHILHYMATKRENDYEHLMLFEKFLCGIPLEQSIQKEIKIDEKHKRKVEKMLGSAVYHWSALKNTSTTILRSEFLQREGKLDWSESNPKLTIERKTHDLLLEKIPWNISIVKIPWIQKLIYTQW
ncbi:hypothetical protein AR687_09030 [Flavobacteriaceae bacterium CRH]|nr:hypothetical protein AR687_09030 [Flavobacteriaceae bacterium CRH]